MPEILNKASKKHLQNSIPDQVQENPHSTNSMVYSKMLLSILETMEKRSKDSNKHTMQIRAKKMNRLCKRNKPRLKDSERLEIQHKKTSTQYCLLKD